MTDNRTTELKLALIKAAEEIGSNEMFATQVYRWVAVKNGRTWDGTNIGRLAGIPVSSIEELSSFRESELRKLHGIGDKSIAVIRLALRESGYDFAPEVLEQCPFCGGNASLYEEIPGGYIVQCHDCCGQIGIMAKERAIAAWNTRAELGSGTCHGDSDLSEWVCSSCQCWIPLGITPENVANVSEWRYCPHCGARVIKRAIKAVE